MSIVDSLVEAMETNCLHSAMDIRGSTGLFIGPAWGIRSHIMAVPVPTPFKSEAQPLTPLEVRMALLIGQGHSLFKVSRVVAGKAGLEPKQVRGWFRRRMRQSQELRDLIWDTSILQIEEAAGSVQKGLLMQAQRGRVDAARLIYELSGRHNPKADGIGIQAVHISVGGEIPRPTVVEVPDGRMELNGRDLDRDETVVELTAEAEDEE